MTNQDYVTRLTPIASKYGMTVKISSSNQVIIIDKKNRFAGYVDTTNQTIIAKKIGSMTLIGSLALYPMIDAIKQ